MPCTETCTEAKREMVGLEAWLTLTYSKEDILALIDPTDDAKIGELDLVFGMVGTNEISLTVHCDLQSGVMSLGEF